MVSSAVYPDLERVPGKQNWVDYAGGLPKYIERIAKHLHYEKGMSISHAIATAVNTVKRWARMGKVAKYGDPNNKHVTAKTAALAAKAVAEWEAKKRAGSLRMSDDLIRIIDLTEVSEEFAIKMLDLADESNTGVESTRCAMLGAMDLTALAERANQITDPEARGRARQSVLDLASTIPPRNARGKAKDGRNSFKRQGRWKHGFIPVDKAAKEAKAKGSPIAMKRMYRLFGKDRDTSQAATGRAGQRSSPNPKRRPVRIKIDEKSHPGSESAKDIGQLHRTPFQGKANLNKVTGGKDRALPKSQKEASKAGRIPERARQNWDEIPEALKTVRNGKRYVLAEFGGRQYITEWIGGVQQVTQTAANARKVMRTLSSVDAANMSVADLRALLNNPRTPASVLKVVRKALKKHAAKPETA